MKNKKTIIELVNAICPNDKHCEYCKHAVENYKGEINCELEKIAVKLINAGYTKTKKNDKA